MRDGEVEARWGHDSRVALDVNGAQTNGLDLRGVTGVYAGEVGEGAVPRRGRQWVGGADRRTGADQQMARLNRRFGGTGERRRGTFFLEVGDICTGFPGRVLFRARAPTN